MPYARISAVYPWPGRTTRVDVQTGEVLSPPLTLSGGEDPAAEPGFIQSVHFKEVSAAYAAKLERMSFAAALPIRADNPPRFEVVPAKEDADAIVASDLAHLKKLANGKNEAVIEAPYRR